MEYSEITKKEIISFVCVRKRVFIAGFLPNHKNNNKKEDLMSEGGNKVFQAQNLVMKASCYSGKTGKSM